MDRSVDSIGSCSLDVDAESTDFSDTSGSFNLLTPSSAKDFPREFITRIHERTHCPPSQFQQQTSIVLDPQSGRINTILSGQQPPPTIVEYPTTPTQESKKPSYLNLACCVNGYSHLTTYDSKLRQNINKSREVSPIRPITYTSLQTYNKLNSGVKNLLVPQQMFRQNGDSIDNQKSLMSPEKRLFTQDMMVTETNGDDTVDNVRHFRATKFIHATKTTTEKIVDDGQQQYKTGSIAQHVERLFGPGALTQGFHTNRRSGENGQVAAVLTEKSMNSRNFFSPIVKVTRKETSKLERNVQADGDGMENLAELEVSLPVLRHLRPEFREQLPICASPRRFVPPARTNHSSQQMSNGTTRHSVMEVNHVNQSNGGHAVKVEEVHIMRENIGDGQVAEINVDKVPMRKDGHYFLDILEKERSRLLTLADKIEGYMELVKAKDDTEEIIGYIRAATGKARLLATQKMKQFEGLCHSNLNQKPDEKFQTTPEDLQGFWDMVMLQVNHVDSLFDEIEGLKGNNWKKNTMEPPVLPPQGAKLTKRPVTTKGTSSTTLGQASKKSASAMLTAKKREEQRKQFMELKRKNRMAMNQGQNGNSSDATKPNDKI